MLEYDFVICYKKGSDNTAVDALSRNVISTPTDKFIATMPDDSGDIITAQENDTFIQDVKAYVKKGTLPCHTVVYRNKVEKTGKDAFIDKGMDETSHWFSVLCTSYTGCFEEDCHGCGSCQNLPEDTVARIELWIDWNLPTGGLAFITT